jgi:hypothetical protein
MNRILEVGKPLTKGITSYQDGQIVADIDDSGLFIRVAYANPTDKEIKNFKEGAAVFGIVAIDQVIFILCKFGELSWMDAPYNIHLSLPDVDVPMASFKEDTGLAMTVVLVDANTGIVKALRLIGLATGLSQKLKALINVQRGLPFDKDKYFAILNKIYAKYSTNDLVKLSFKD